MSTPTLRRLLVFSLLLLVVLDWTASAALAGPHGPSLTTRATVFVSGLVTELINDRTRLIQASVFIVVLGIALLWWRK